MTSALCHAGGLLKHLIDNLDGKHGEEWLEIFRRTLRRQNPFELPQLTFEPAFVLDVKRRLLTQDVLTVLNRNLFGNSVDYLRRFGQDWFIGAAFNQPIVVVTPEQLGVRPLMGHGSDLAHLWVRAEELGLKPCLPSSAPYAAMQYPEWFLGKEKVYFASSPFGGQQWCAYENSGRVMLDVCPASLNTDVFPKEQWAFWLPEK